MLPLEDGGLIRPRQVIDSIFEQARIDGYSDRDMASFAGVHVNTIENWRAGRSKPGFSEIVTMAQMMGFRFTFQT